MRFPCTQYVPGMFTDTVVVPQLSTVPSVQETDVLVDVRMVHGVPSPSTTAADKGRGCAGGHCGVEGGGGWRTALVVSCVHANAEGTERNREVTI